MFFFGCACLSLSPDRQRTGGLLRKFRRVDKHQLEQKFQITNLASQTGADDPRPVPAFPLAAASKVDQYWRQEKRSQIKTMVFNFPFG